MSRQTWNLKVDLKSGLKIRVKNSHLKNCWFENLDTMKTTEKKEEGERKSTRR